MGYDIARFQSEVDEEFICLICSGVLEEPVMVPLCEHVFCKDCINEWLDQQRSCPVDRQPVTSGELMLVPRILKNFLSRLFITCDYAHLGCTVIVKLERLEAHWKECEHNPNRLVPCKYGCGAVITKDESQHSCVRKLRDMLKSQEHRINEMREDVRLLRDMLKSQEHRINEMREDVRLLRAHTEDYVSAIRFTHPAFSTDNQFSEEGKNLSWIRSLERGRVTNWDALIAAPDSVMLCKICKDLIESGCPLHLAVKLVMNAHVKRWPPGLRTLEAQIANRRYYENCYCRKIPGEQAIAIMAVDNPHMNDDMVLEPGLVIIFSHGIDVPTRFIQT